MFVCSTTLNEIVAKANERDYERNEKIESDPRFISTIVSKRENEREKRKKNEIVLGKHFAFSLALSSHKRARGSGFRHCLRPGT